MTALKVLCAASLLLIAGCEWGRETLDEALIRFDNLSASDVRHRIEPLLSEKGTMSFHGNRVRVVDRHQNVVEVREMLLGGEERSPFTANLRFGLILASDQGAVDANLVDVAAALRELVRFQGFQLIGERVLSATEGDDADGRMTMTPGNDQYIVSMEVEDIRANNSRDGSVELTVRLRRENRDNMISTNVVVPVGQTVVLGRAHPDGPERAVLLTVRPELGVAPPSARVRTGQRQPGRTADPSVVVDTVHSGHVIEGVHVDPRVQVGQAGPLMRDEIQLRAAREALNTTLLAAVAQLDALYREALISRPEYERGLREAGLTAAAAQARAVRQLPARAPRTRATTVPPPSQE
jgi:hypothetical protein